VASRGKQAEARGGRWGHAQGCWPSGSELCSLQALAASVRLLEVFKGCWLGIQGGEITLNTRVLT